uniref:PRA1 family protein n=1 Tax=Poecilia mexicana TaxID=48701 RepID=A0A3B3YD64_9TELE
GYAGLELPSFSTPFHSSPAASSSFHKKKMSVGKNWNGATVSEALYFQPIQMFVGMTVVTTLFLGFIWAAENKAPIRRFRRNHPLLAVLAILLASYLFISVLGGVAVFLFGIASPVLMVLVHASMRLRNLKNKLENKLESIGLKRTPMGLLLEALGQDEKVIIIESVVKDREPGERVKLSK